MAGDYWLNDHWLNDDERLSLAVSYCRTTYVLTPVPQRSVSTLGLLATVLTVFCACTQHFFSTIEIRDIFGDSFNWGQGGQIGERLVTLPWGGGRGHVCKCDEALIVSTELVNDKCVHPPLCHIELQLITICTATEKVCQFVIIPTFQLYLTITRSPTNASLAN